ncbi:hypothetical protein ACHAW6_001138, partial [Cyclotella cf. meneghiniana]
MPTLHTIDIKQARKMPHDTTASGPIISTVTTHDTGDNFSPVTQAAALAVIDRKRPLPCPSPPKKSKKRSSIATTPHGSGPWSHEENVAFRRACLFYGIGCWKNISTMIPSRTAEQVKSHAQKMKLHHPALWDELVRRSENGMDLSNLVWLDEFAKSKDGVAKSKVSIADANHKQSKPLNTTTAQGPTEIHRPKEKNTVQPRYGTNIWTKTEHLAFCRACCLLGVGNWKRISELIPTRSATQVKSHAQKVKLHRPDEWRMLELRIYEEIEHEEGRDDERNGEKFMHERSLAVDQQLEIAGNLLLLASGDGDNNDSVGGSLLGQSNNTDCTEESCSSRISTPQLRRDQNVFASQAIASNSAKLCYEDIKYSRIETPRNRSVMGYNATILFGKEIAESNSGGSGALSQHGVMHSGSNLKCGASCDKTKQKSLKKCVQEAEPDTLKRKSDNADCNTNGSLLPDETIDGDLVFPNESHSLHENGASSSGF